MDRVLCGGLGSECKENHGSWCFANYELRPSEVLVLEYMKGVMARGKEIQLCCALVCAGLVWNSRECFSHCVWPPCKRIAGKELQACK